MELELILIAAAAFVFAGSIKGLVGLGLPTALISLLAQVMDPRTAIAILLLPSLILNAWQVWGSGGFLENLRRVWLFALVMFITIWYFSRFSASLDVDVLIVGIGAMILIFVATNLLKPPPPIPAHWDKPVQVVVALFAGVIGGLTAIWSPPMVMYLMSRRYAKDEFIGTLGVLILCGSIPLFIGYWQAGLLTIPLAGISAMMIVPAMIGFAIGEWGRRWLDPAQFKRFVLLAFFLMGLNLIRRGFL